MHRYFVRFFFLFLFCFSEIFAFGGKRPPVKSVIRVYKVDKPDRKLTFVAFDNLTGNKEVDYLRKDIPQSIYSHFNNKQYNVVVSEDDLKPSWKEQDNYEQKVYNYYVENTSATSASVKTEEDEAKAKTKDALEDITKTKTESETTEEEKKEELFRGEKVYKKNETPLSDWLVENVPKGYFFKKEEGSDEKKDKKVTFYLAKDEYFYLDARSSDFDPSLLINDGNTSEFLINDYNEDTHQLEKVIFKETNRFKRNLITKNEVLEVESTKLEDIVGEMDSHQVDYALYGQIVAASGIKKADGFVASGVSSVKVKIFLIKAKQRTIELIYEKEITPYQGFLELQSIPVIALAAIQNKELVHDVKFSDNSQNTFVYLDGVFVGKTPLNIKSYPKGDYKLELWNKDAQIDYMSLSKNKNIILEENKLRKNRRIYIKLQDKPGFKDVVFETTVDDRRGYAEIEVDRGKDTKLYVDAKLTSVFRRTTRLDLPVGNYFASLNSDSNFEVMRMVLPIKPNTITRIKVRYKNLIPIPHWQAELFNHNRNHKIFAALTAITSLATFGVWIYSQDINMKVHELERVGDVYGKNYIAYRNSNDRARVAYFSMMGVSLFFLGITFASRILDMKRNEYKIVTKPGKTKYYELEFVPFNSASGPFVHQRPSEESKPAKGKQVLKGDEE